MACDRDALALSVGLQLARRRRQVLRKEKEPLLPAESALQALMYAAADSQARRKTPFRGNNTNFWS